MEEELDDIEKAKIDWRAAMAEFYDGFQRDLEHAQRHMTDIKRMEKPTDLVCDKCGKPMGDQVGPSRQLHRMYRIPRLHQYSRADWI
jgi:DNA topoisomerase-1